MLSSEATLGNNYQHRKIKLSTYGIIFCGTPHMGSDKAKFAEIVTAAASVFYSTNRDLLKHLKSNSNTLWEDLCRFTNIHDHFKMHFAYETHRTVVAGKSLEVSAISNQPVPPR